MDRHDFALAIKNNPELAERLLEVAKKIKETKDILVGSAKTYSEKYKDEIAEGTKKRQLLLAEGHNKGLTDAEIISQSGFLPTVHTPILNYLHFIDREDKNGSNVGSKGGLEALTEACIKEYGYEDLVKTLQESVDDNVEITFEDEVSGDNTEKPKEMEEFIYGNCTSSTFQTIKKLKNLSKSDNKKEAFLAYTKCIELCKKYNLEFDKIPCNIK